MKTILSLVLSLTSISAFAQVSAVQFLEFPTPKLGSYALNMDSNFDGVCYILTGKKDKYVKKSALAGSKEKDTVEVNSKGVVVAHPEGKKKRVIARISCNVNGF